MPSHDTYLIALMFKHTTTLRLKKPGTRTSQRRNLSSSASENSNRLQRLGGPGLSETHTKCRQAETASGFCGQTLGQPSIGGGSHFMPASMQT